MKQTQGAYASGYQFETKYVRFNVTHIRLPTSAIAQYQLAALLRTMYLSTVDIIEAPDAEKQIRAALHYTGTKRDS